MAQSIDQEVLERQWVMLQGVSERYLLRQRREIAEEIKAEALAGAGARQRRGACRPVVVVPVHAPGSMAIAAVFVAHPAAAFERKRPIRDVLPGPLTHR